MAKAKQQVNTGPVGSPMVRYGSKQYFADLRLREFREIENPHNGIVFDSEKGQLMCRQAGIICCPKCGMSVIISKVFEQQRLRCMQCTGSIRPSVSE